MNRILLSMATIGVVGGAAVMGYTGAFFSDTETSEGNSFIAGELDLTIDSMAHYNGMYCAEVSEDVYQWHDEGSDSTVPGEAQTAVVPEMLGTDCVGTWDAQDLNADGGNPFFDFDDIKPGDQGENTISVHVENNDAWLTMRLIGNENADNGINEPESEAPDTTDGLWCGELAQNMTYQMWVDFGQVEGWQCSDEAETAGCSDDPLEGNNILDGLEAESDSGLVLDPAVAESLCNGPTPEPGALATAWSTPVEVAAGQTQYLGLAWSVPSEVGNEIQTDSINFDVEFMVEQVRNNPTPFVTLAP